MNKKQKISIVLNICIVICAVVCLWFLYSIMDAGSLRMVITIAIILSVILLLVCEYIFWRRTSANKKGRHQDISTLILLGEDDRPIKVWDLSGKVGLLIGKSSDEHPVDIDLSDIDYSSFIDIEHALLNFQETGWWISDTSSGNGVSIMRRGQELLLGHNAPARLETGDVICIAKYTRIAVS